ncbi:hypothetical protein GCM10009647_062150 [Streptomyces sanglieri]
MVETTEATHVTRAASSLLFPELDFEIAANGTYPSEDFHRVLARIAFDNEFANTARKPISLPLAMRLELTQPLDTRLNGRSSIICVDSTRTRSN